MFLYIKVSSGDSLICHCPAPLYYTSCPSISYRSFLHSNGVPAAWLEVFGTLKLQTNPQRSVAKYIILDFICRVLTVLVEKPSAW